MTSGAILTYTGPEWLLIVRRPASVTNHRHKGIASTELDAALAWARPLAGQLDIEVY